MTKKDYDMLAQAIANMPSPLTQGDVAKAIAVAIMDSNKRFNMTKFLAACRAAGARSSVLPTQTGDQHAK